MNSYQKTALIMIERDIMRLETRLASLKKTKKRIQKEANIQGDENK